MIGSNLVLSLLLHPLRDLRNGAEIQMARMNDGKVVLCVDDEAVGLAVRKQVLEARGYRVLTAENGPDALEIFSAEPVHLVILDYKMPGMNGNVVAERMKQLKPSVPILMLSAYVDLPRETLALVDMSLTKGEGPLIMLKAVADLLTQMPKAVPGP
jgi:CheY-like chemotaxis protein